MHSNRVSKVLADLKRLISGVMPEKSEETRRVHLLAATGVLVFAVGMFLLVVQLIITLAVPSLPPAPWTDIVMDIATMFMGGLMLWLARSARVRLAACIMLTSFLIISTAQLYLRRDSTNIVGAFGLFLVVVLAIVFLDQRSAWMAFTIAAALSFIGVNGLWLMGYLPWPEPSWNVLGQALFLIISWLLCATIIFIVVGSNVSMLRDQAKMLKLRITERKRVEEALRESEDKYRSLIEQSGDAIYLLYGDKFEIINPRFEDIFGITPEEAQAPDFDFMELVAPKSRPLVKERVRRLEAGEELDLRYEFTALDRMGKRIEVEVSVSYVPYRGGMATQGVLRDITARKRMEQEREHLLAQIGRQAQLVQQILATVPEGVLLLDADGRIRQANPVAEGDLAVLAGAEVGDVITHLGDRQLDELLTSPPTKGLWHEVRSEGRVFEVIARPMEDRTELKNWVLVMRDVTQEREVQRRVHQQERLASVGQLAAGVAHDFNNIMSTIALYAQMMAQTEENLSPRCQSQLKTIDEQAQRAIELIQQILDFSRRSVLEQRPLDLVPLLKEQVKLLERTLPESIQIKLRYGRGDHTVNADPTRIQQVVMNLAVNARDAMPEGGDLDIDLDRVTIKPNERPPLPEMERGDWVRMTVSDNGEGIPDDVLPHIFDPFFTTKEVGEGTGLGLAQVWGIVKQHEGHVDVSTAVGVGTTFTLYLPALIIRPPQSLLPEEQSLIRGEGELILLVEDNPSLRRAIMGILRQLNYRVLAAADGLEALEIMEQREEEIALVLSDVVMPRMGGKALLHALREQGASVPIVLLTGHTLEEELDGLLSEGLDDWLIKPPSLGQLSKTVRQALEQSGVSS